MIVNFFLFLNHFLLFLFLFCLVRHFPHVDHALLFLILHQVGVDNAKLLQVFKVAFQSPFYFLEHFDVKVVVIVNIGVQDVFQGTQIAPERSNLGTFELASLDELLDVLQGFGGLSSGGLHQELLLIHFQRHCFLLPAVHPLIHFGVLALYLAY